MSSSTKEALLPLVEQQADALQAMLDETAAKNALLLRVFVLVRAFLVDRRRVCYGGTAINNLLPKSEQFYGATDVPDYDAYSAEAIQDAKDMVDVLRKHGVPNAEARAGVHVGTFKVYADYVAVLDLTELPPDVFQCLQATASPDARDGLLYAHPMYLRVSMHLELSRPMGDVSRWSKVAQRLVLLDEAYPFQDDVQRLETTLRDVHAGWPLLVDDDDAEEKDIDGGVAGNNSSSGKDDDDDDASMLATAVDVLAKEGAVFSGAFASCVFNELDASSASLSSYRAARATPAAPVVIVIASSSSPPPPCMDVLVHGLGPVGGRLAAALGCGGGAAARIAKIQKEAAEQNAAAKKKKRCSWTVATTSGGRRLVLFAPVSDLVSWRLELVAAAPQRRRLFAVYETNGCHAYNEMTMSRSFLNAAFSNCCGEDGGRAGRSLPRARKIRLSNMDDSVAFLGHVAFVPRMQRLDALATVRAILTIFARRGVDQRAPWARFQLPCLGEQHGLVEMRREKAATVAEFKKRGLTAGDPEYDRWFLKYDATENKKRSSTTHRSSKTTTPKGKKKNRSSSNTRRRRIGGSSSSTSGSRRRPRVSSWTRRLFGKL